jgi:phage-related protein
MIDFKLVEFCGSALEDAVHVLHGLQKQTPKTGKADLNLGAQRYRDLPKEWGQ